MRKFFFSILFIVFGIGYGNSVKSQNITTAKYCWKECDEACKYRSVKDYLIIDSIYAIKTLTQASILDILGKPDKLEKTKYNTTALTYYLNINLCGKKRKRKLANSAITIIIDNKTSKVLSVDGVNA